MNRNYRKVSAALKNGARSYSTIAVNNKMKLSTVVRLITTHAELLRMYTENRGKL